MHYFSRIEENAFQDLWDLEKLYLSKNGISAIYRDTFRNLPSLEKLYLEDNLVKDLGMLRDYQTVYT
jgi:Leucine-rich repeat (LRR) protein